MLYNTISLLGSSLSKGSDSGISALQSLDTVAWCCIAYAYILIAAVVVGIPMYVTGSVCISKARKRASFSSLDEAVFKLGKYKTRMTVFFVLSLTIPILGLVFFILMLVTRGSAMRYIRTIKGRFVDNTPYSYGTNVPTTALSAADEIKQYKQLLDEGIITQEEYDAKKRQLLNL